MYYLLNLIILIIVFIRVVMAGIYMTWVYCVRAKILYGETKTRKKLANATVLNRKVFDVNLERYIKIIARIFITKIVLTIIIIIVIMIKNNNANNNANNNNNNKKIIMSIIYNARTPIHSSQSANVSVFIIALCSLISVLFRVQCHTRRQNSFTNQKSQNFKLLWVTFKEQQS